VAIRGKSKDKKSKLQAPNLKQIPMTQIPNK
jgi:hypothetical protein